MAISLPSIITGPARRRRASRIPRDPASAARWSPETSDHVLREARLGRVDPAYLLRAAAALDASR